jgi:hypothetical protein
METKIARHFFKVPAPLFLSFRYGRTAYPKVPSIEAILPENSAGGQPQFWGKRLAQKIP